jgi:hypothetical protein
MVEVVQVAERSKAFLRSSCERPRAGEIMLKKSVRRTVLGLVFLSASWGSESQAQELNWAQKMFEKQSHDFGVVARGADVKHRFKITNLYRDPVHITNIRTTCGCTAAKPSRNSFNSREEAYIEVTMDTRKFMRRKDSHLIVTFDSPLYAQVQIPITAYIRTDVVLDPGGVNFGAVEQGNQAQRKLTIQYAGRSDWKIKKVKTNNKHITAKIVEKSRGGGRVTYELQTSLEPSAPAGRLSQQITLVTDDANSPHVPVLVEAKVEADVTITVASSLGTIEAGKSKNFNVVLRGKKPFVIEKVDCASDQNAFKIKLSKATRTVHVLPIAFTAPEKAGVFSEEFTVTITGRPEPVTFKTKATITNPKDTSEVDKSDDKLNSANSDKKLKSANSSDEKLKSATNSE